jgi:carboxypeptidase family protein
MKYKLTRGLLRATVAFCLSLSLPALAQNCRITGRVLDNNRAAVATAVVTATQVDSGLKRQVLSNSQGYFQLAQLPPGSYRIEAVKPGFAPLSRTGVDLEAGMTITLDLQMKEAEVSETVTLEARKTSAESLIVYICGLWLGSGCEMLEPALSAVTLSPATADPPEFP